MFGPTRCTDERSETSYKNLPTTPRIPGINVSYVDRNARITASTLRIAPPNVETLQLGAMKPRANHDFGRLQNNQFSRGRKSQKLFVVKVVGHEDPPAAVFGNLLKLCRIELFRILAELHDFAGTIAKTASLGPQGSGVRE